MATWRLLGMLPRGRSSEENRARSLGGWNPWRYSWSRSDQPPIIVPNVQNQACPWHVHVSEAGPPDAIVRFAALRQDNDEWWFYVPTEPGEEGAFEAGTPKCEGFWRTRYDELSELPWPAAEESWQGRSRFLEALSKKEKLATRIAYRGYSSCRLCGCRNGFESLRLAEWEWPAGFRHYIEQHFVRPSQEFTTFIMGTVG
jgi:hypothetical protein